MPLRPSIVWFRQDLRLDDHPALHAAIQRGAPIVPAYVWAPEEEGDWRPGAAVRWWLHQNLAALDDSLRRIGSELVIRRGPSLDTLLRLARDCDAGAVFWNRRYEPAIVRRDKQIKKELQGRGLHVESFNGSLLYEPWEVKTGQGGPYRVFTPFWRACLSLPAPGSPLASPTELASVKPEGEALADLSLEPRIGWTGAMRKTWLPGEAGAAKQFARFRESALNRYATDRDLPGVEGTSRLSPYLHVGAISPRRLWHELRRIDATPWTRQLFWREFAHHLLFHYPHTALEPLRENFRAFPWKDDPRKLEAWQRGRTGFPIVDAGMRELWAIGWMHNRVRMIVASFLVKDLLIPWQEGARWFWDTLIDADLANNTLGWQWTAGCGADAAPYFRIFNPESQAHKFDPDGAYVRRWAGDEKIDPIVDHSLARDSALAAYARITAKT